jgi:hypothetical protein
MPLALGDNADVEAGVEQLAGCELPEPIEGEIEGEIEAGAV